MYSSPAVLSQFTRSPPSAPTDERPFFLRRSRNSPATNAAINSINTPVVTSAPKKKSDALFGPNIGSISHGPAWTEIALKEKKIVQDELTPEVVKGWVERSLQASQPTTTLQALVNLKRPTIRLSPLVASAAPDESNTDVVAQQQQHHHGLEFEYDCDAPRCGIYVHVLLDSHHPDAGTTGTPSPDGTVKVLVFETVVDGGFGSRLTLDQGAVLELGRFEHGPTSSPANESSVNILPQVNESTTSVNATPVNGTDSTSPLSAGETTRRRRFTHFHFRRRTGGHSVSGPALALVDAAAARDVMPDVADEGNGVRIIIRVAALDASGAELSAPNEQVTYLHVVRFGAKPAGDDTRPWVVRVVKREASIGPHTFQLHEIYGLTTANTTSSTHAPAPTAPLPLSEPETTGAQSDNPPTADIRHSYPPKSNSPEDSGAQARPVLRTMLSATTPNLSALTASQEEEDSAASECLLCLSSPREVVLLPCRHLVACKECALNMVEFGAGGIITHAEEGVSEAADNTAAGTDVGDAAPANAAAPPLTPAAIARRKRKAKGWFCPVCRQPYTSLLRITTTPPAAAPATEVEASTSGLTHEHDHLPGISTETSTDPLNVSDGTRGILNGLRPGFMRALTRGGTAERDVERQ